MIYLGTLAGLLEHQHELHAYCPRCDAWRVLLLNALDGTDLSVTDCHNHW
jgi:hypothetical protein